jgi:aldehyde:ferredoxin oxidoreductase
MIPFGRILEIDLSSEQVTTTSLSKSVIEKYLGGRGFNVWYLRTHLPAGIDPLGPENILILSCGLLTGTSAPTSSRLHINSLSPHTGILGSSNIGGYFGAKLRACEIQSLIIRGKATHPVYIYIDEDGVEIRDARPFRGMDTYETPVHIQKDVGHDRSKILTIGPAGENMVPFACIISDRDHAAGRTGMGAVMGSKNLKALVVARVDRKAPVQSTPDAEKVIERYVRQVKASPEYQMFVQHGSAGYLQWADEKGMVGAYNFRETRFDGMDQIDGKNLHKHRTRSRGCYRCPVQCKSELRFKNGNFKDYTGTRPEFEPMMNLGAKCGLKDIQRIVYLDNLCSRLGLDAISTGSVIAFAMDLYDRGILKPEDTGNLDLAWGNGSSMETLIRQMAFGEGLGALLAKGVRHAAKIIGRGAEAYAPHVKGLELTGYHPGAILGTALGFAVSSRGGDYSNVYPTLEVRWSAEKATEEFGTPSAVDRHTPSGKGRLINRSVLVNIILDCLGLCRIPALSLIGGYDLENEAALTAALTDLSFQAKDLFQAGERIACLERLFNMRQGTASQDDILPPMFLDDDAADLNADALKRMRHEYYKTMGWDSKGRPMKDKLAQLGISDN